MCPADGGSEPEFVVVHGLGVKTKNAICEPPRNLTPSDKKLSPTTGNADTE